VPRHAGAREIGSAWRGQTPRIQSSVGCALRGERKHNASETESAGVRDMGACLYPPLPEL